MDTPLSQCPGGMISVHDFFSKGFQYMIFSYVIAVIKFLLRSFVIILNGLEIQELFSIVAVFIQFISQFNSQMSAIKIWLLQ